MNSAEMKEFFYDWMGGNENVFFLVNSMRGHTMDIAVQYASWLSDPMRFKSYLVGLIMFAALTIMLRLMTSARATWHYTTSWIGVFVVLLIGFVVFQYVTTYLVDYFSYPRPYIALSSTGKVIQLETMPQEEDFRSFPSRNVAFATMLLVALWPLLHGIVVWLGILAVLFVAWSRMSVGVNFPSDVIAGALFAAPITFVLREIIYFFFRKVLKIKC